MNILITLKLNQLNMRAMTKQQLARYAGVDVKTLRRWCEMHSEQLEKLGMFTH